jgi:hypothetical protein
VNDLYIVFGAANSKGLVALPRRGAGEQGHGRSEVMTTGSCEACEERERAGPEGAAVRKMFDGLQKLDSQHIGGESRTDFAYYVCQRCGREWTEIVDSGFGGHGHYLHPGRAR